MSIDPPLQGRPSRSKWIEPPVECEFTLQ
jgi:hypothetical protein